MRGFKAIEVAGSIFIGVEYYAGLGWVFFNPNDIFFITMNIQGEVEGNDKYLLHIVSDCC